MCRNSAITDHPSHSIRSKYEELQQYPSNMGCLSSKIITRSMSFKELNQNLQKSANSLATLEDLAASKSIDNQLLALVHTSSSLASELRSGSFSKSCPEPEVKPSSLEQEAQEKQGKPAALMILPQPAKGDLTKRSRSCHWFPEDNSLERNRGIRRARSFHTIEEYDAMVERIRQSMAEEIGSNGKEGSSTTNVHFDVSQSSSRLSNHDMGDICIWEIPESNSKDKDSPEENSKSKMEATSISPGSELENRMPVSDAKRTNANSDKQALEKDSKRESVATGLESLEVPQNIEFQTVASLREWLRAGEACSPGAHATPQLGSYSLPNSGTEDECNDSAIFNPELVAAFEDCMQQLEADAEAILNQIADNFDEEILMEKQSQDEIFHMTSAYQV